MKVRSISELIYLPGVVIPAMVGILEARGMDDLTTNISG